LPGLRRRERELALRAAQIAIADRIGGPRLAGRQRRGRERQRQCTAASEPRQSGPFHP
jgi:hypothetical protein